MGIIYEDDQREFEWDDDKNERTQSQRGFDFAYASRIFGGDTLNTTLAGEHGEKRLLTIGQVEDITLAVIWTRREGRIRIISARRASRKERRAYDQAFRQANP